MGIIAVFSCIAILFLVLGSIFSEQKRNRNICLIVAAVLVVVATGGFIVEWYSGNHPEVNVETYRAFSIELGETTIINFEDAMLITKTSTKYKYASVFHAWTTEYDVRPLD